MLSQVGGIAHQYGLITERVDPDSVSLMMMVLPLASVFGRLAGGFLLERVPMLGFTAVMMFLQAAALVLLGLAQSAVLICLGLALLGVTVGNLLMLQPLIIAERYGCSVIVGCFLGRTWRASPGSPQVRVCWVGWWACILVMKSRFWWPGDLARWRGLSFCYA